MNEQQTPCRETDGDCEGFDNSEPSCFHVVAVGASAGGLESLEQFFKTMPAASGMAFIVLQHLSPDFRSLMDELLARHTTMTIRKAEDDMEVQANTIYLNPPRKNMIVSGGNLYLSELEPNEPMSLPIDQFFRSLAQDYRRQAIAIVLSGTGSDGSRGIRDVYEAGGLVLAETEESAQFDGMPRSAQETGCVHLVLHPEAMPEALVSYVNQALSPQDFAEKVFVPPRLSGMETVFRLIRDEYGIDFSHYKPNTVVRRVERRIALLHSANVEAYGEQLEKDPEELNSLYRDLLIGVTRFFRDREAFDYLESDIIPELVENKENGDELRVWSAGCATGEEAYSIAILIDEAVQAAGKKLNVKVFATDVHPVSLEFAGAGVYPEEAFAHVDVVRVKQYFDETADGYKARNRLRQMIVFAKHNVFKDAPFTKLDLVSCRNLLIYLQTLAQKKALSLFHFGLRTQGVLVLGPSESPGELKDEFETLNNRWKVYRKRRDVRLPAEVRLPLGTSTEQVSSQTPGPGSKTPNTPQRNLMLAYDRILERFVPAAFLINDDRELIHVFGDGKNYLEGHTGRVSTDLLDMVRSDLKPVLASAIQRVRRGTETRVATAVRLDADGDALDLRIQVDKLSDDRSRQVWFFVSLELESSPSAAKNPVEKISAAEFSQDRMNDLEVELRYTKESLQTTVEELETSNEELQATNEELVASNEELQSTNEELHSVNEELYTVNAEYQDKISELTELTNDMESLLESTEIGTIFLDKKLAIRKYTGKVVEWFNLVSRDIGRNVSNFSHKLNHPGLMEDVEEVLNGGQPLEREIQDESGEWLHLRLHPYHQDDAVKGVVMTLIDISNLKQTRAKLQRLSAIVESSDDAIIGKNFVGRIESWNKGAEKLFGYTSEEAVGQDITLILPEGAADDAPQYFEKIRRGESVEPLETQRRTKDGRIIDIAWRLSPIRDVDGQVIAMSAICRDISTRKLAERELERLALVVQHTDNAVVLTNPEGRVEWVNEAFARISGFSLADIKGSKPGHLLQGPESDPKTIELMRDRIAAGEGFNVEIVNYTKDRRAYWLAIDARPIHNHEGQLTGFIAVQRDITTLKDAQSKAQREVERRDEFLAMLSHELRNPLSALKNGIEILERTGAGNPDQRRETEEVMQAQVAQMSRLLDDLLDVSRITQDKILIQKENIDLRPTAREASAAVEPLANRRGCPIRLELPDDPVTVNGDSARLQQVQVNLLTNAIRHSRQGDPVTLRLEKESANAVITVSDIGEGIRQDQQPRVFDLFFQTSSQLARTEGGLGVGLSLVRDLVAKHEGKVTLHSEGPDQGSTFRVTIPLVQHASPIGDEPMGRPLSPMRIVVVEDQAANRLMLRKLLELDGHQVWEAESAGHGIELIDKQRPDLALVDIGLPDMPGYEVARRVRRMDSAANMLLAALTGYGQESDIEEAHEAGFDFHLTKPLDIAKLTHFIHSSHADRT